MGRGKRGERNGEGERQERRKKKEEKGDAHRVDDSPVPLEHLGGREAVAVEGLVVWRRKRTEKGLFDRQRKIKKGKGGEANETHPSSKQQ